MSKFQDLVTIFFSLRVVGALSVMVLMVALVFDGSLLSLYRLSQREVELTNKINKIEEMTADLKSKLETASKPGALVRQARTRFDLVGEDDLIFVFTD